MSSSSPQKLEGGLFTIVVGFDFSEVSSYALEQAARIARRIPTCELHVVHVAEPRDGGLSHEQLSRLRRYVQEKARTVGGWQEQRAGVHVRVGDVDAEIIQLASDVEADLIVVGRHPGPHVRDLFRGAATARLMREAPCPVMIAGPKPHPARLEELEPKIEPPCPACVHARFASKGKTWWCTRHSARTIRPHTYSYSFGNPFDLHDSEVTPTGASFRS